MGKILTLEVPDDVNRYLEEEAKARGLKPEVVVLEWVKEKAEEERYQKGKKKRKIYPSAEEEIAQFGVYQMGEFKPLTKEELYGDR